MLTITIPGAEVFDESLDEFITMPSQTLELEHSLVSLSKWESEFESPFMGEKKTTEQTLAYIRHMTLNDVDPLVYRQITSEHISQISAYIDRKMTATWFVEDLTPSGPRSSEQITSELIYYWMVALTIPFECQHWHINRLLTLIKVCNVKNKPAKKMPQKEAMSPQRALNEARRAKHNTSG